MPPHGAYLYLDTGQGMEKPLKPWGWFFYSPDMTLCQRIYNVMQPDLYDDGGLLYIFAAEKLGDGWIRADDALENMGEPDFHHRELYERAITVAEKLQPVSTKWKSTSIERASAEFRSSEQKTLPCIICFSKSDDCEEWEGCASIENPVLAQAITMYLQRRYGKSDKVNFCVVNPRQVGLWLLAQDQVEETAGFFLDELEQKISRPVVSSDRAVIENYLNFDPLEIDDSYVDSLRYHMVAMRKLAVLEAMDNKELDAAFDNVLKGFDGLEDDSDEARDSTTVRDAASETEFARLRVNCTHADDFTWVIWYGQKYTFAKGHQAQALRELWRSWEASGKNDGCGLSEKTIGERCGSSATNFRLTHTFRGHPALNTMIRACKKGTFALFSPKSQENHSS